MSSLQIRDAIKGSIAIGKGEQGPVGPVGPQGPIGDNNVCIGLSPTLEAEIWFDANDDDYSDVIVTQSEIKDFKENVSNSVSEFEAGVKSFKENIAAENLAFKNEIDNSINSYKTDTDSKISGYINEVNEDFEEFTSTVSGNLRTFEDSNNTFKNDVNTSISKHKTDVDSSITSFKNNINSSITSFKNEVNNSNETFKSAIKEGQENFIETVNKDIFEDSKIDFFGKEHDKLEHRLNADFDNVHQRINESELLPYEGTSIKADNSYYGLTKDTVIKGRTLQNCIKDVANLYHSKGSYNNKWITIQQKTDEDVAFSYLVENILLKPNTDYTMFLEINENTIIDKDSTYTNHFTLSRSGLGYGDFACDLNSVFGKGAGETGLFREKFAYREVNGNRGVKIGTGGFISKSTTGNNGKIVFRIFILEGDHTQTPLEELPFIEGIESVGESELTDDGYKVSGKSIGKNLFDGIIEEGAISGVSGADLLSDTNNRTGYIRVEPNKDYRFSKNGTTQNSNIYYYSKDKKFLSHETLTTIHTPKECVYIRLSWAKTTVTNEDILQINEGTNILPYEPYQESNYSYILNEPLRSLPNGVCDTIDLETGVLTRRVGKVVIDGSENWYAWTNIQMIQDTHVAFTLGHDFIGTNYKNSKENNLLCNNFMVSDNPSTINNSKPYRLCALNIHELYSLQFKIEKTALVSADCNGFKQWLQANPTTVIYELAEPTTEQLTPQQLKSFDTTTHIISDNKLMPVISTKIHSNVQAIISTLRLENSDLKNNVEVLTVENEGLKSVNNVQDEMIDINMLASDELYTLIEPLLVDMLSERGVSKLVDMYVAMVQRGLKTLDEVPARYREQVREILEALEK